MRFVSNWRFFNVGKILISPRKATCRDMSMGTGLSPGTPYPMRTELENYLRKLKLERFQCFEEEKINKPCLEVLKTSYEDLDVVHVRKRQPQVLYMRIELLLQRINFLKPIRTTARQKRRHIERNPPVLVLEYDYDRPQGKQVGFLRGIVKGEDGVTHIIHPCSSMIVMRSFDLVNKVEYIQEQLGMAQQSVLKLILNMPSFLIHNKSRMDEKFVLFHRYMLPQGFDLDYDTAELYPPIYQRNDKLNPLIHTKHADEELVSSLPTLTLSDVLDYSYKEDHGKGQPEDLNQYLKFAESRELRPRYNKIM